MANAVFELNCFSLLRPFLGAGIGCAHAQGKWSGQLIEYANPFFLENKRVHSRLNQTGFSWQAIAGLRYPFCSSFSTTVECRYFHTEPSIGNYKFCVSISKIF